MVYRRQGSSRWWITVATRVPGEYVHLSTGTRDEPTGRAMEAMWTLLGAAGRRQWEFVDAVLERRCTLARLYDHYVAGTLERLRAELADVDLAVGITAWDAQLEDQFRGETPRKYRHHIAALFPRDAEARYLAAPRSVVLEPGYLARRLATVGSSRTNRRRHHEAWTAAFEYLKDHAFVTANPMGDVKKPKPDASRTPHLDRLEDVLRLVHAFETPMHRAAAALREGAGMEIQSVIAMRARDVVDLEARIVWAHGDKNAWRDRQVRVDPECWEIFLAYYRSARWLPDARLFPTSADAHRRWHGKAVVAMRAAGFPVPAGYTPHAARHTYAIRHMRANDELTLIANNLGHSDTTEVQRLYGKYRPAITDIVRAGQPARGQG